jgi:predicted transcriptional regulator
MNINYQETSREAWRSFLPDSAKLDRLIMKSLEDLGEVTCQRIEGYIDRDHQAVSGNLRHLVEKNLVEDSGRRGKTRSGRSAILWRIVNPTDQFSLGL